MRKKINEPRPAGSSSKIGAQLLSCLLVGGFFLIPLPGCTVSTLSSMNSRLPVKKVRTPEELLHALKEGLNAGQLGSAEFYKNRIGYEFAKFPENTKNPKEFTYGNDEAVKMDEGLFSGRVVGLKKWTMDNNKRILDVSFPIPGCVKKWQAERIFMEVFEVVPTSVVFGVRPENWYSIYRVSRKYDSREQVVSFFVGEKDDCLQSVIASEIYQ